MLAHPLRDLNFRFMVAEWFWIIAGCNEVGLLTPYNSRMAEFSDDGQTLAGAYGPRLMPQLAWVVQKLVEDPDTRQAVATIWTPTPAKSKDVPCTVALQWLLREGKLHCICTMRSSDLWLGLPYDVFVFSQLTNMLAGHLEVETGSLTMQLGSSHLYDTDFDKVDKILEIYDRSDNVVIDQGETLQSCRLPGFPVRSQIIAALNGDRFEVPNEADDDIHDTWRCYADILIVCRTKKEALDGLSTF